MKIVSYIILYIFSIFELIFMKLIKNSALNRQGFLISDRDFMDNNIKKSKNISKGYY